ncbi:hypothetical protein L873DRAFT_1794145 [Choiromyces venosus 120613-1]|uniref:Uncharacterized protein n=1 Tax=Choiromyces venosus 120613-1 TaxID=1336337 RepID=A0A3N4J3D2_9PEZI|nr:hypothetical protein L873DRAFT_1794145 [Choiromyces venosus 120613-1]
MIFNSFTSFLVLGTTLVSAIPAPIQQQSTCVSGLPFTGQAGCSTCKIEGKTVCGRDEDRTTDLKCTRFSTGLVWVPVDDPGTCGVDSPSTNLNSRATSSTCPSGKPFTGQAGCSTCATEGKIVCGRDEDKIADLKCTRFSTGLVWVPVNNPGTCGVDSPSTNLNSRATSPTCPSGKPFTGQAGCSTCAIVGNIVCGRDEDQIADLKCTKFSTGPVWVPVNNPGKCGVDSPSLSPAGCPSGKPFTGQAGCSKCMIEGNIVCGRDEDLIADLKCTRFGTGLTWVPVNNPGKCGV